jgi:DNA polymerase-3 subunit chi
MTRVDFYFNAPGKLEVLTKLVVKATSAGKCVLIYTQDAAQARQVDQFLWSARVLSFIPHLPCQHAKAADTPVLIGADPDRIASPDVLINLDAAVPECFSRFERVLEIVTEEAGELELSRQHYRLFKQKGYALETHDLKGRT